METQKLHQKVSLALRPRLRTALRDRFTKGKDTPPQAPPQNQESAQQSQQNSEAVATQFHLFPYLPPELRLQVWSQATRYKRYVILDPPCNSAAACAKFWLRWSRYRAGVLVGDRKPAWTSRTGPPPLLSVSREAREVALKTWQPAFSYGVFPASVYINFDQDDVVVGAGARVNNLVEYLYTIVPNCLRPHSSFVASCMVGVWTNTPDVQKIQRVVACGNFMRGMSRIVSGRELMNELKSLTILRISEVKLDLATFEINRTYTTTRRSRKGAPLLSLGGIDFLKTEGDYIWASQPLAELEVMDFVGGRPWADFLSCWTVGPQGRGWESMGDNFPMQVHLGPGQHCVRRAKWHCHVKNFDTNIWYAI